MLRWEDHEGHIRMTSCFSPKAPDGRTTVRYILKVSIVLCWERCILSNDHSSLRAKQWCFSNCNTQKVSLLSWILQRMSFNIALVIWLISSLNAVAKYLFEQIQTLLNVNQEVSLLSVSPHSSILTPVTVHIHIHIIVITFAYSLQHRIFFPQRGLNSSCLQWDHGVPTTGLPQRVPRSYDFHDGLMLLHFVLPDFIFLLNFFPKK